MTRKLLVSLSLALLAGLPARAARADLSVVATVPDLAALARAIGGDKVKVESMALPTQDAHFVDAKPSMALTLNRADLLLAVGLDLELGWLPVLQTGARNAAIQRGGRGFVECSQFIEPLEVPAGAIDRSMGDIHPGGNPHYLHDPRRARACARGIAERMAALDPGNEEAYLANLRRLEKGLDALIDRWESRFRRHRGAAIVTYHNSWVYLTDWLGLEVVETLEPKPGISPSPRHVARVIKTIQQRKARLILHESYYPARTGRLIADRTGARLLVLPGATDVRAGQSYLARMNELLTALDEALGK